MAPPARLNERAAAKPGDFLWHVDAGWSLFAGTLGRNAPHAHSAAVYLAGLYDTFRLRVADGPWRTCRAAVVRAGTPYEFDVGQPLGVLYLEPSMGRAEALAPMLREGEEVRGALIGSGDVGFIRELFERRPTASDLSAITAEMLVAAKARTRRAMDARISRAAELLQSLGDAACPVQEIASAAGMSPSRFQHLFTAEVGVPFRRYRSWQRLRGAIRSAAAGASLTEAAHAAGFADQAHFSRAFRAAFGAPPSRGL